MVDAAYMRMLLGGTLVGGEFWSIGVAFGDRSGNAGQFTHASIAAHAAAIEQEVNWNDYPTLMKALGLGNYITRCRLSYYDANDRMLDYAEQNFASPVGGTGVIAMPVTVACCISIATARVGRSGRGRFYWPAMGLQLQSGSGLFTATNTAALATESAALLTKVPQVGDGGSFDAVVVRSKVTPAGQTGPGGIAVATGFRVGNVPDSQRGRKGGLVESYSQVAYAPPGGGPFG